MLGRVAMRGARSVMQTRVAPSNFALRLNGARAFSSAPAAENDWFEQNFPEGYHKAWFFIGVYSGLFVLYKVFSGGKKPEEAVVAAPSSTVATSTDGAGEFPWSGVTLETVGDFAEDEANITASIAVLENEESLSKVLAGLEESLKAAN